MTNELIEIEELEMELAKDPHGTSSHWRDTADWLLTRYKNARKRAMVAEEQMTREHAASCWEGGINFAVLGNNACEVCRQVGKPFGSEEVKCE